MSLSKDDEQLREDFNDRLHNYVSDQYEADSHTAFMYAQDAFYDYVQSLITVKQRELLARLSEKKKVLGYDDTTNKAIRAVPIEVIDAELQGLGEAK